MRTPRWLRVTSPWLFDATLALVFLVAGQVESSIHSSDGYHGGPPWVNHVVALLVTAPVLLRRAAPRAALLLISAGLLVPSLVVAHSLFFWSGLLPVCFVVYPAARLLDGRLGRWSWFLTSLAVLSEMLRVPSARELSNVVLTLLALGACAFAGRLVRRGSSQKTRLGEALEQLAAEQRAAVASVAAAERARIAVEVQDVVAHALGLMLVQVGAARLGLEGARLQVPEQLRAAESTGRSALSELRRTIGVLGPQGDAPLEPLPGLSMLPDLVRGFRSAGLDVSLDVEPGATADLTSGLQLTAYRILQESLTNVLRHAGRVTARVVVRRTASGLVLEVTNPLGRPAQPRVLHGLPSGGHGLVGMRERAAMFAGTLSAEPSEGQFVVHAVLQVVTSPTSSASEPATRTLA